ncbi:MAG: UbiD family decarboxylase, partial [Magnetococcales bacterium]|nr:UbiD family decarboxylase [Magnetococcales bacterium]
TSIFSDSPDKPICCTINARPTAESRIIGLKKAYPGHAFKVMAGVWRFLRQFLYIKYIIVVDVESMDDVLTARQIRHRCHSQILR